MLHKLKGWLAARRAERQRREEQQVEDFVRADDERRRRAEPVEPLQHDYPIDSESRQPF